ncbi:MAG: lamin tail domain-containing protein [Longimonas sp.]|uniref:lamin tail domain-containing protein n=1 Tax=Longimonas sp. TaxID=2039626 RepID=UPI003356F841
MPLWYSYASSCRFTSRVIWKRAAHFAGLVLIGLLLAAQPAAAQQDLLGYWNFNDPVENGNPWPAPVEATFGDAQITYSFDGGNLNDFQGNTGNAQGGDPAGESFSVAGESENGEHFDIAVSTEGTENIELAFWTRRTGTGFDNNTVSYSTDGGSNFTQEFTFDPNSTTSGAVETFDFSGIAALNDNPEVVFRITLDGATSGSGNNRYDNITVRGDLLPAEGPVALSAIDAPAVLNFQGFRGSGFVPSPNLGQLNSNAFAVFGTGGDNLNFGGTKTGGAFAQGTRTNDAFSGGIYAFDVSKPDNLDNGYGAYTLGLKPTSGDFTPGTVYVCYENTTGTRINGGLDVAYDLWVLNDEDRSQSVELKYAVGSACQTDDDKASSFEESGLVFEIDEPADSNPEWTRNQLDTTLPAAVPTGEFITLAFVTDDVSGSDARPQFGFNDISVTPRTADGGPIVIENTNDTLFEDFNTFRGTGFASPADPDQLDSQAFIVRGLSDGDLAFGDTQTTGDFARGTSTGGVTTGGIYAFEVDADDFAWGAQPTGSDFTPGAFVARYLNDTGTRIDDVAVAYDIEVFNDQDRATSFNLTYKVTDEDTFTEGGFIDVPALDYTTPQDADSSPDWQTVPRAGALTDLNLQNGEYLLLRWTTDDAEGSGSRDEIALNNLSLTPNPPVVELVDTGAAVWSTDGTAAFDVQLRNPDGTERTVEVAFQEASSTANPADVNNVGTQTVTFPASASDGDTQTVTVDLNAFSGDATRTALFTLQNATAGTSIGQQRTYTLNIGDAPRVLISRYVYASEGGGGIPRGIQVWNVSGETINFAEEPLAINTYFNGSSSPTTQPTIHTGELQANGVLLIGDNDDTGGLRAFRDNTCAGVSYFVREPWFNGDDVVELVLGGRTEDVLGTIGEQPDPGWEGNGVSTFNQYLGVQPGTTAGTRNGFEDPSTRFLTLVDASTSPDDLNGFCDAPWPEVQFFASEATVVQGDTESTTLGATLQLTPFEGRLTETTVTFDEASSSATGASIDGFDSETVTFPAGSPADTTEAVLNFTFPANTSQDGPLDAVFTLDVENCFTAECFAQASGGALTVTILDRGSAPDVLISEFLATPAAVSDANGEWIELYNTTDSDIDLSNWALQTAAATDADLSGTLPARSFLTVCRNDAISENGGVRCDQQADIELDNDGATLVVKDDNGDPVTTVEYGTARSSGTLDPVTGASNVFTGTAQNNNADRWAVAERREKGFLFTRGRSIRTDLGAPGQNGPKQQLQPAATIDGNSGWRMLAPPVTDFTVADLDVQNMVQGVPDLPLGGQANVYRWEETGWASASSGSDPLPAGEGFIWYMWDTSAPVNQYSPFPFTLSGQGPSPADDVTVNVEDGGTTDSDGDPAGNDVEWHLLGNPYPYAFDLNAINLVDQSFSTTAQIWDPSRNGGSGSYIQRSQENAGEARLIGPWQGFFVSRVSGSAATLTFNADGRRLAPTAPKSAAPDTRQARIAFTLSGYDGAGAIQTHDEAFEVFLHPDATMAFDVRSAVKLSPMTGTYVTLSGYGTRNSKPIRLSRYSLPFALDAPVSVPVVVDAQNIDDIDQLTLRWPTLQGVPTGWQVYLRDLETGAEINLREARAYTFDADPATMSTARATTSTMAHGPHTATTIDQHVEPLHEGEEANVRFEIHITPTDEFGDPLPVELTDFTVQTRASTATLQWTTLSETDNAGFEVQHQGPDAADFAPLGFVAGQGTTDAETTYRFETDPLLPGTHQFRLRQVDTDGTATLTETQRVAVQLDRPAELAVYPSPVRTSATVRFAVDTAQEVVIDLYNTLGQRVQTLHQGVVAPHQTTSVQLHAAALASGLYIVRLRGESAQQTQSIMVVR